jgi:hypothetical protein
MVLIPNCQKLRLDVIPCTLDYPQLLCNLADCSDKRKRSTILCFGFFKRLHCDSSKTFGIRSPSDATPEVPDAYFVVGALTEPSLSFSNPSFPLSFSFR